MFYVILAMCCFMVVISVGKKRPSKFQQELNSLNYAIKIIFATGYALQITNHPREVQECFEELAKLFKLKNSPQLLKNMEERFLECRVVILEIATIVYDICMHSDDAHDVVQYLKKHPLVPKKEQDYKSTMLTLLKAYKEDLLQTFFNSDKGNRRVKKPKSYKLNPKYFNNVANRFMKYMCMEPNPNNVVLIFIRKNEFSTTCIPQQGKLTTKEILSIYDNYTPVFVAEQLKKSNQSDPTYARTLKTITKDASLCEKMLEDPDLMPVLYHCKPVAKAALEGKKIETV